jgi:GTP-binding protein
MARLKRAAKTTPLLVSAVSGAGVPEVLRALFEVIEQARKIDEPRATAEAWRP